MVVNKMLIGTILFMSFILARTYL